MCCSKNKKNFYSSVVNTKSFIKSFIIHLHTFPLNSNKTFALLTNIKYQNILILICVLTDPRTEMNFQLKYMSELIICTESSEGYDISLYVYTISIHYLLYSPNQQPHPHHTVACHPVRKEAFSPTKLLLSFQF